MSPHVLHRFLSFLCPARSLSSFVSTHTVVRNDRSCHLFPLQFCNIFSCQISMLKINGIRKQVPQQRFLVINMVALSLVFCGECSGIFALKPPRRYRSKETPTHSFPLKKLSGTIALVIHYNCNFANLLSTSPTPHYRRTTIKCRAYLQKCV